MDKNVLNNTNIELLLAHYNFDFSQATITPLGNGHINCTYKLSTPEFEFVLQRINHDIFINPVQLCGNAQQINRHLVKQKNNANYPLMVPQQVVSNDGDIAVKIDGYYWRLMEFIEGSYTLE